MGDNERIMHIAFVHPRWPTSEGTGATHSATQIIDGLVEQENEVTVYCAKTPPSDLEYGEVELRSLGDSSRIPHTNTQLNRAIEARTSEFEQYDVLDCYLTELLPSIATVGRETSTGTVLALNGYAGVCPKNDLLAFDSGHCTSKSVSKCLACSAVTSGGHDEFNPVYRTLNRVGNLRLILQGGRRRNEIDAFRALSPHVKSNYVNFGFARDDIDVVPLPMDPKFYRDHESEFEEPYKLLYVGSLDKHKGVDLLVPILASLLESDFDFQLTIVGTGGLESNLRKQSKEYDVADSVEIAGFIQYCDLPRVYESHDCFIYPGVWEEPFGRVFLEALGTGTPVVSREYGGIDQILGDAGYLTDGTVSGFKNAILNLVKSGNLPSLSIAAKLKAKEYQRKTVISRIEEIYQAVA